MNLSSIAKVLCLQRFIPRNTHRCYRVLAPVVYSQRCCRVLAPVIHSRNLNEIHDSIKNQFHTNNNILKQTCAVHRYFSNSTEHESDEVTCELISNSDDLLLIDVRNPDELNEIGTIPGSCNIPLNELQDALMLNNEQFLQKYGFENTEENMDKVVFFCQAGVRSSMALQLAKYLGFENVRHLQGGYSAWLNNR